MKKPAGCIARVLEVQITLAQRGGTAKSSSRWQINRVEEENLHMFRC